MMRATAITVLAAAVLAAPAYGQQMIGGCPMLPADNIWNTPVDTLPVLANSATMVNTIGASRGFHADFGAGMWDGGPIGIPFVTVPATQTKYPATFLYDDESDPGPYAVPLNAPIEGGPNATGDRHAIALDTGNCLLYELYRAFPGGSAWTADSGAIYDLRSNALRPSTWTSADAAGLPIMPGLVTVDEVLSGEIRHAIRFTVPQTRREFVWPARHYASSLTGTQYPRMGERFRLKASFDIAPYPADVQVILRAMKKYGILLADNGSAWYISGAPDPRWNDDNLHTLSQLLGANFEAVDATVLRVSADSGAARQDRRRGHGVAVVRVGAGRPDTDVHGDGERRHRRRDVECQRRAGRRRQRRDHRHQRAVSGAGDGSRADRDGARDEPLRTDRKRIGCRHGAAAPVDQFGQPTVVPRRGVHVDGERSRVHAQRRRLVRRRAAFHGVRIVHAVDRDRDRKRQPVGAGVRDDERRHGVEHSGCDGHRTDTAAGCRRGHLAGHGERPYQADAPVHGHGHRQFEHVGRLEGQRRHRRQHHRRTGESGRALHCAAPAAVAGHRQRERHLGGGRHEKRVRAGHDLALTRRAV
jgi:hypothetical protein